MSICIYSKKTEPDVNFKKQEHIFPASLGGISKLPKGYVSDEINEKFSSDLEIEFMRESIISIPRQFIGPGSRGNINNDKKATKSKVHLMIDDDNRCSLGYIILGKPVSLNQIIFNFDNSGNLADSHQAIFAPNTEDAVDEIKQFLNLNESITLIKDNKIPSNKIILGIHKYQNKGKGPILSKWFIGHNGSVHINDSLKSKLKTGIERLYDSSKGKKFDLTITSKQVTSYQNLSFDMDRFFRTCAKIAFNYIADIIGPSIVLKKEFDGIRNYIVNGGESNFVAFAKDTNQSNHPIFDCLNDTHTLIADFTNDCIIVSIVFYGSTHMVVRIPYITSMNELPDCFNVKGIVIDWQNRNEYDFFKYILERYKGGDYTIEEF